MKHSKIMRQFSFMVLQSHESGRVVRDPLKKRQINKKINLISKK